MNTFSGARLRANGMGTMAMLWPIVDSNEQTLDYTQQDILPAMKGDAFVCACINANDPLKDMRSVLEQLKAMGVLLGVEHRAVDLLRRQGQRHLPGAASAASRSRTRSTCSSSRASWTW